MVSIEKCREVLNKSGKKYTENQIREIRESLYVMASYVLEMQKG